jgi:hypothetical protein
MVAVGVAAEKEDLGVGPEVKEVGVAEEVAAQAKHPSAPPIVYTGSGSRC